MRNKTKMLPFIGLSVILHALVILALTLRFQPEYLKLQDPAFVQLDNNKPIDLNPPKPFIIGDEDRTNKKPVINTNFQELRKEDESGGGSSDFSGYAQSYQVDELPVPVSPITPVYPEEARRTGVEGKVIVLLCIDEFGNVKKVEIQKSPSELLSQSAREAVSSARFIPAKIAGTARAVCMQLTLKFHLE
jgi:protein TonB